MEQKDYLEAGIDYNEGVARFVGNAAMYEKFLRTFPTDRTFAELADAMERKDTNAAFQAAHTLKGLTGNLSLNTLYKDLVVFTDALRGEGNMPLAESLYPGLMAEYESVKSFIENNVK